MIVISDLTTASRYFPWYEQRDTQPDQKPAVCFRHSSAFTSGAPPLRCEGCHVSTKGTRSPALTTNSAWCARSRPTILTGVLSQTESGPATAQIAWSTRRTQGTIRP